MSTVTFEQFLDQVVASPELQQELQACENKETLVNRILELANGVSREDIESALKKKRKDIGIDQLSMTIEDIGDLMRAY